MSSFLYRLGRFAVARRWIVLAAWIAVVVAIGGLAATLGGELSESFSLPKTESQDAAELLEERFPQLSGSTATVVVAAEDLPARRGAIADLAEDLAAVPGVRNVSDPFAPGAVAPSGDVLQISVAVSESAFEVTDETFSGLEAAVASARTSDLTVELGGDAASASSNEPPAGSTEAIGLLVAVVVLTLMFGQLRAMGLTLLNALVGVFVSIAAVLSIAAFVEIPSVAEILGLMIGLAVGIDYALFIVSRHRDQVRDGMEVNESIARAMATAGGAVVFAGATVVIAMGGLLIVGIPFVSLMALSVVLAVVLAVLVSTTLLPAMLGFSGAKIAKVTLPVLRSRTPRPPGEQLGARWARWVTKRPWLSFLAGLAVIGVLAAPLLDLRTAMPNDGTAPEDSSRRAAYDLIAEGFGAGYNAPLLVVVDHAGLDAASAQAAVGQVAQTLSQSEDVVVVAPTMPNTAGDTTVVRAIPTDGPAAPRTIALVQSLRADSLAGIERETGVTTYVTGATAFSIDIDDRMLGRLPWLMAVVIGLTFLVLMVAFRSLLVPLKAAVGILLSIAAAMGLVVAVFQWGWGAPALGVHTPTPIISFLPVIAFAILFGLSMDYEVFILSRVREEWVRTGDAQNSVVNGVGVTARVITAAAAIMIAVFGGFILGDDVTVKMVGLGLAAAVLIDATLVRLVLVPSTMVMFDKANWWLPGWLDRLIPNVDIEGERLLQRLRAEDAAAAAPDRTPARLSS